MFTTSSERIRGCTRCGTCCSKGGPVLHQQDKNILLEGHIRYQHLVTLRKGEQAYNPATGLAGPIPSELIKIAGGDGDWRCIFHDEATASCAIYLHRPLECRLLKCWDTSGIISVMGKDTLRRSDIINPGDPVLELIEKHEGECPNDGLEGLISSVASGKRPGSLARLKRLVHNDLSIREFAFKELGLQRDLEMFIFGRPLTCILEKRGLKVVLNESEA